MSWRCDLQEVPAGNMQGYISGKYKMVSGHLIRDGRDMCAR